MRADVAPVFFALGEPTRLAIVSRLGAGAQLSATSLADGAAVTRQAISKHLRVLEGARLVTAERRGREVLYGLETAQLDRARAYLESVSQGWDRALERLRVMVESPTGARSKRGRRWPSTS